MKVKFCLVQHRSTLEEAIKTKKYISENEMKMLMYRYTYYCFDNRINSIRYIAKDIEKTPYTWLHIEVVM